MDTRVLESVDIGVTLSEDPLWTPHVDNTGTKASRTLGFLRRNMFHCTDKVQEWIYNALLPTCPLQLQLGNKGEPAMSATTIGIESLQ